MTEKREKTVDRVTAPIYILLVCIGMMTSRQKLLPVSYLTPYLCGMANICLCTVCYLYKNGGHIRLNKNILFAAACLFLPTLLSFLYSMAVNLCVPCGLGGYETRALGMVAYGAVAAVQAMAGYFCYGKKGVTYAFAGTALCYLLSCGVAISENGLTQFRSLLSDSTYMGSVLEMHEVAPVAALFAVYFMYDRRHNGEKWSVTLAKEAVCLFIIVCSAKRIVLLASVLMIFVFEFLSTKKHTRRYMYRMIVLIGTCLILAIFAFVWAIESGFLFAMFEKFGINTMSRTELWSGMNGQYRFGLTFPGRGMGFVSKWMDYNWQTLNIRGLSGATGIHSDILKYYIELGFFGSLLYYAFHLLYVPRRLKKRVGNNAFVLYFVLFVLEILIWFTDNISVYHNFQWCLFLLVFAAIGSVPEGERNGE